MIKMYLKIQDIFTRLNEFLPDMSGGQSDFLKDYYENGNTTNTLFYLRRMYG